MTNKYRVFEDEEGDQLEITETKSVERTKVISKVELLKQKKEIDDLLKQFSNEKEA